MYLLCQLFYFIYTTKVVCSLYGACARYLKSVIYHSYDLLKAEHS